MATGVITRDGATGIAFDELYRMTVDRYERLAESGVLDDPQIELLNGLLVNKMTKKPAHVSACELVAGAVESLLPRGWYIREQNPLRIPDYDEPEPDVVVARGSRGTYVSRHPGPEDVALVVEVADTSLMRDRGEKLSAYSRGGVPVYWIVNLTGGTPLGSGQVEVYSDPDVQQGRYRGKAFHDRSSSVPVVVEGTELGRISVAEMLPPQTC